MDTSVTNLDSDATGPAHGARPEYLLFDAMPVAATVVSPDGTLEWANEAYLRLTGYAAEDLPGTDPRLLIHPDERWAAGEITDALINGTPLVERVHRCCRADGSAFRGRLLCSLLPTAAGPKVLTVIEDVTELHAAREELERSEVRHRKLLENVTEVVTLFTTTGEVLWSTAGVRGSLGYDEDTWEGRSGWDLVHPDDLPAVQSLLTRLLEEPGSLAGCEARLRHANGFWDLHALTGMNLLDDPDVAGIAVTSRSISRERAVAEELERRRDEAEQTSRAKTEYVANVTHEIRTPLHAILGISELLCAGGLGTEESRLADAVQREARNLREVIDGILDFSRIEAGRMELADQPFSPAAVADRVGQLLRGGAEAKRLTFTVEVDPTVPRAVKGDEARVRQVLVNLAGNAVKYTERGRAGIRVHRADDGSLCFEVSDTGRGIPADDLERIFEPFTQARSDDARRGTGLGLAISRRLVALMGGRLEVSSEVGVGTTFRVWIPVVEAAADTIPTTPTVTGGRVTGARVLVVEDNEVNRKLARSQLERLGHHPTLAPDGETALNLLAVERFDLILMDWFMPGMDGLEATRRWRRAEPDDEHVPIIAMTASSAADNREECIAAGMDDFLPKPVSIHDLGSMLDHWLGDGATGDGDGVDLTASTSVDGGVIETLVAELGDRRLVASVIGTYLRELPNRRRALAEALADERGEDVRRAAHTLKSTSATLGAERLATLCADLERSPDPTPQRREDVLRELDSAAGETQVELARWAVTLGAEA